VEIVPSLSFLDLAYERLGIDPVESGLRLVDGHTFATDAAGERGPMLVAHCHANWVLSEIKLAVEDAAGDEPVVILQRLGSPDEAVVRTTWAELDRTVEADHLTSIYVEHLAAPVGHEYVRFHQLARVLREQCPWDREQTHASLVPYLLEETYEVVDAIDRYAPDDADSDDHLLEELGDLLYQIEFHAVIAQQEGRFTMADVARSIHDKLVRRHPHVFGDAAQHDTDEASLAEQWETIKAAEQERSGPFDGVPRSLPALSFAAKVLKRAERAGLPGPGTATVASDLGDRLLALVAECRAAGVDPELALRAATDRYVELHERH
jgi:tetrapyrrole methylase family protein/MazG family protein